MNTDGSLHDPHQRGRRRPTDRGKHGYPQRVVANDDGLSLIAETYTNPDVPSIDADGIALMRNALPTEPRAPLEPPDLDAIREHWGYAGPSHVAAKEDIDALLAHIEAQERSLKLESVAKRTAIGELRRAERRIEELERENAELRPKGDEEIWRMDKASAIHLEGSNAAPLRIPPGILAPDVVQDPGDPCAEQQSEIDRLRELLREWRRRALAHENLSLVLYETDDALSERPQ